MSFFDKFPYTNFHELNLDWIISQLATVKDSMLKAVESAKNAKVSEDNANESANKALWAKDRAVNAETNARNSENAATDAAERARTSETNAKASEDKAKISETNAKASEDNAKISETNAKASENKAKVSETNAKASEDIAQEAETNASASATKAENIASTLTNWSELDKELKRETALRKVEDNVRITLATDEVNFSGNAYDIISNSMGTEIDTTITPPVLNGVNKYEYHYARNSVQYKAYYAPIYLTIGRSSLDLTAGTHTYSLNIPNIKYVLPKNVAYSDDMILRLKQGYFFYVSTPNGTRSLYEMIPRTSSSFQINSIELIPNVDATHDAIQILINYTVGADYSARYSETYIKLMFYVELYKKLN